MADKQADQISEQYVRLQSHHKMMRSELAALQRENEAHERELDAMRNNLSAAENQIKIIKSSVTYRVGVLVVNSRSIRGLIRLPWRLFRIFAEYRKNRPLVKVGINSLEKDKASSRNIDKRPDFSRLWVGTDSVGKNNEIRFEQPENGAIEAVLTAKHLKGTLEFSLPFTHGEPPFDLSTKLRVTIAETSRDGDIHSFEFTGPISGHRSYHAFAPDGPLSVLFPYRPTSNTAVRVTVRMSFDDPARASEMLCTLPKLYWREYEPGMSVILPSYKGRSTIERCLASLKAQTLAPEDFEVIIILNGPDDQTGKFLVDFSRDNPDLNLHVIKASVAGAGNARNLGIEVARREYITFIDDDDYVSTNYLGELLAASSPDRVALATVLDVDASGQTTDNIINQQLKNSESYTVCHYKDISSVLTMNACKSLPTFLAAQLRFDTSMKSGEDVCFFSRYFSRYSPNLNLAPVKSDATYYRVLTENSVSRRPQSFAFNVEERLAVIQAIDACYPFVGEKYKREFLISKMMAQSNFVRSYLESHRGEIGHYASLLQGTPIHFDYDKQIAASLSETLVYSYCFSPYLDTAGIVMAKRIQARGLPVDVVCNSMDGIRKSDKRLDLITAGLVGKKIVLQGRPSFSSWPEIKRFADQAEKEIRLIENQRAPYTEIYSRAMWIASHFAAALHKIRQPEVFWRAEFSDPLLKDVHGENREMELEPAWLKKAGFYAALKHKGITPPRTNNLFVWGEFLVYAFADEVVFTNSNQFSYMMGYSGLPDDLISEVRARSIVEHHPTLPSVFYSISVPSYTIDEKFINVAYFGSFYATRGLGEVFQALSYVAKNGFNNVKLHVFTGNIDDALSESQSLGVRDNVIINQYVGFYEFLALTNQFDCLLVNDANTKDIKDINPYLPSKLSDYLGSNSSIWALCEEGSVLHDISKTDKTGRMIASYCGDHESHVMALKLLHERS